MLKPNLKGTRFTIRTDKEALRWILNMTYAKGKLEKVPLRLSVFEYDVGHRAGIKHQAADVLYRLETSGDDKEPVDDHILLLLLVDAGDERHEFICNDCDGPKPQVLMPEVLIIETADAPQSVPNLVGEQEED